MTRGFTIKIFVPNGSADGLRIVEKSNWSGRGIVCPRADYADNKKRPDFHSTGVYILIGPSEDNELPTVYVGEGDPVKPRLDSHFANKDFWTRAIFFTSKDENLNKAHIQHIESRLVGLATELNRCVLDNGNSPSLPNLSEMDVAEAEGFLDEVLLCLPILGVSAFLKPEQTQRTDELLYLKGAEATATGYENSDGFVVLEGSQARVTSVPSMGSNVGDMRERLVLRKIFDPKGDQYLLTQDYTFNSPSLAAAVMMGRSANGRTEWKTKDGTTLKELQEREVDRE